jgi:phage terminase large subunit-like protein|tara:strand:+ start:184 stop:405 length:222 start_codon:yes stop_codon:yes gene_type:complete
MKANEFIFWLKGIMDSTQFMPTKKTWDTIVDNLKEVDTSNCKSINDNGGTYYVNPPQPFKIERKDNEPPEILC